MVLPQVKLDLYIFVDGKIFFCAMFRTDMLSIHRLVYSQQKCLALPMIANSLYTLGNVNNKMLNLPTSTNSHLP